MGSIGMRRVLAILAAGFLAPPTLAARPSLGDGPPPAAGAPAKAATGADRPRRDDRISLVISGKRIDRKFGADRVTAGVATRADVAAFLRHLEFEFSVYTPGLVARSGLKRVIVCGRLEFNGVEFGGLADQDSGTIYFNAEGVEANRDSCKEIVHHEMYHLLDKAGGLDVEDPRWEALNWRGFRYGSLGDAVGIGGRMRGYERDGLTPGFLNRYSTASKAEDKATVFALLLADPRSVEVQAGYDPVLRAKVAEVRRRVARLAPAEAGRFWDEARAHADRGEAGRRPAPRVARSSPPAAQGAGAASRPAK